MRRQNRKVGVLTSKCPTLGPEAAQRAAGRDTARRWVHARSFGSGVGRLNHAGRSAARIPWRSTRRPNARAILATSMRAVATRPRALCRQAAPGSSGARIRNSSVTELSCDFTKLLLLAVKDANPALPAGGQIVAASCHSYDMIQHCELQPPRRGVPGNGAFPPGLCILDGVLALRATHYRRGD